MSSNFIRSPILTVMNYILVKSLVNYFFAYAKFYHQFFDKTGNLNRSKFKNKEYERCVTLTIFKSIQCLALAHGDEFIESQRKYFDDWIITCSIDIELDIPTTKYYELAIKLNATRSHLSINSFLIPLNILFSISFYCPVIGVTSRLETFVADTRSAFHLFFCDVTAGR